MDYTQEQVCPMKPWQSGVCLVLHFDLKKKPLEVKKLGGIDLEGRSKDVRLLFYKRQAKQVARLGLDPEDVLQEVYKGLMIRNDGTCPYDPTKSAFSTYVVMVMNCVVMNIVKKRKLYNEREVVGKDDDAVTMSKCVTHEGFDDELILDEVRKKFSGDNLKVYDALMEGAKHAHIAEQFGWELKKVTLCVKEIRTKVAHFLGRKEEL